MYDGTDDVRKLGRFTAWNYNTTTEYYPGSCGKIKGTSGELWYPVMDDESIEVFSPDLCRCLELFKLKTLLRFQSNIDTFSYRKKLEYLLLQLTAVSICFLKLH